MRKLAIISTHPIQYNAPLFEMLTRRGNIALKVFYTWGEAVLKDKYDPGFGKSIKWDIPLLEGYDFSFVKNISADAGSHHFKGIDNPSLIKEISGWGADAVLLYGWSFKSHLQAMRHFKGRIPVLFRGDSTSLQESSFLKKMMRRIFLHWVYSYVDTALYVGTHNKQYYLAHGLKERQLVFGPHAIDNSRFEHIYLQKKAEMHEWRAGLGIAAHAVLVLYAGKLDDNKNVQLLIRAFNWLAAGNVHLLVTGNGAREEELKAVAEHNERIHFLPFQNQARMPLLYGMSDLFVLPSISETWGLGINEAMACHTAILASSGCGAAVDIVKDSVNGYVFKNSDAADLGAKLELLTANRDVLKEMGDQSAIIIKQWDFERTCRSIEERVLQAQG